jgi:general secretion pathway protein G
MRKKRPITLLEIMIVIFLIGLIGSVIGYNMKGSLDEGKAFKSRQGAKQIEEILLLQIAKGFPRDEVASEPENHLKDSGLVKDVDKMMKDGWGKKYRIVNVGNDSLRVVSDKLKEYDRSKKKNEEMASQEDDEE